MRHYNSQKLQNLQQVVMTRDHSACAWKGVPQSARDAEVKAPAQPVLRAQLLWLHSTMLSIIHATHLPGHKAGSAGHTSRRGSCVLCHAWPVQIYFKGQHSQMHARCALTLTPSMLSKKTLTGHTRGPWVRAHMRHCSALSSIWCSAHRCVARIVNCTVLMRVQVADKQTKQLVYLSPSTSSCTGKKRICMTHLWTRTLCGALALAERAK